MREVSYCSSLNTLPGSCWVKHTSLLVHLCMSLPYKQIKVLHKLQMKWLAEKHCCGSWRAERKPRFDEMIDLRREILPPLVCASPPKPERPSITRNLSPTNRVVMIETGSFKVLSKNDKTRVRDPASWLPMATGSNSCNIAFTNHHLFENFILWGFPHLNKAESLVSPINELPTKWILVHGNRTKSVSIVMFEYSERGDEIWNIAAQSTLARAPSRLVKSNWRVVKLSRSERKQWLRYSCIERGVWGELERICVTGLCGFTL